MQRNHFDGKLIRLLKATMNGVQCKVKVSNVMYETFESLSNVRQDDRLSSMLVISFWKV